MHKIKKKKLKQGVCQYCKSEIGIFNKFHDIYTCRDCWEDKNKRIRFFYTNKQRADYDGKW